MPFFFKAFADTYRCLGWLKRRWYLESLYTYPVRHAAETAIVEQVYLTLLYPVKYLQFFALKRKDVFIFSRLSFLRTFYTQ